VRAGCGGRKDEGDASFEDGEEVEEVVERGEVGREVAFVKGLSSSVGCPEKKMREDTRKGRKRTHCR
jgi:hypothetical protein